MKFIYSLIVGLALINTSFAQVGFNNANPDPSSVLDLTSTDKGILIPRMTTTQRLAIATPATSLLVFDNTLGKYFYYNSSGQWIAINPWDQSSTTSVSYTGSVGVNITPAASAAMDVTATDKGILVPRMTTTQRTAIASPANALMVFDITLGKFCYYTNSQWNVLESIWSRGTGTNISYTGQVGVNNTTPDPSSTLDLTATDKGILVPRMTTAQRTAIASPANALMVFDITLGKFCYYTNSQWNVVESIWSRGTGTNISYTGQVGVNITTPDASSTVDMTSTNKGLLIPRMTTAQRQAITSPATSLMVFDTNDSRFYFYNSGQWYAVNALDRLAGSTTITHTGNLTVTGTVSATNFSGVAGVPTGVIVMWSGTIANIPAGWALCDGGGSPARPDLSGRFIVGYKSGDTDYGTIANKAGSASHTISIGEMPSHTHSYRMRTNWGNDGGSVYAQGEDGGTFANASTTTNATGGTGTSATGTSSTTIVANTAIDMRPPYYVLAYIIKQ
jgi:microcystin-dependent protein